MRGGEQIAGPLTAGVGQRPAGHAGEGIVDPHDAIVRVGDQHQRRRVLGHQRQPLQFGGLLLQPRRLPTHGASRRFQQRQAQQQQEGRTEQQSQQVLVLVAGVVLPGLRTQGRHQPLRSRQHRRGLGLHGEHGGQQIGAVPGLGLAQQLAAVAPQAFAGGTPGLRRRGGLPGVQGPLAGQPLVQYGGIFGGRVEQGPQRHRMLTASGRVGGHQCRQAADLVGMGALGAGGFDQLGVGVQQGVRAQQVPAMSQQRQRQHGTGQGDEQRPPAVGLAGGRLGWAALRARQQRRLGRGGFGHGLRTVLEHGSGNMPRAWSKGYRPLRRRM